MAKRDHLSPMTTAFLLLATISLASILTAPPVHSQSTVTTVSVGNGPYGVAYDSGKGEIFVTDNYNDTVSVISDATNKVVANVDLKGGPLGVVYDSGKGGCS